MDKKNKKLNGDGGVRAPAVEKATDSIREKIFTREYNSGLLLTETVLAEEYQMSRGSIRSALFVLEKEGLVATQPNGRKLVLGINEKYVNELYETRALLECEAVQYCFRRKVMDFSPLAMAIAEFYTVGTDPLRRAVANSGFHRTLVALADARPLVQCWETLESSLTAVHKANYTGLGDRMTIEILVQEHKDLLELIVGKNKKAFASLRKHIMVARDDSLAGIKRMGWL